MKLETLGEQLDSVRERLLVLLDPLADEVLLQPATLGEWSIADLLAHLVVWEAELVTGLRQIEQGRRPARLLQALADREQYNTSRHAENQGRELDRIFADLQGVRRQLEQGLEQFSSRDLADPRRYRWLEGRPLWQVVAACSFQHEAEHLPALERLTTQLLAPNISLASIEVKKP